MEMLVLELTVVGEICVEILRRSESVPDLLQLARLGHVPLEDVLCHLFLTIFNNNRLKIQSIKFKLSWFNNNNCAVLSIKSIKIYSKCHIFGT